MTLDEEPEAEEGAPAWMTSFADMLVLMLCFFVLLSSFAKTDAATFASAAGSLREALGSAPEASVRADAPAAVAAAPAVQTTAASPEPAALMARPDAVLRVREFLAARGLAASVDVSRSERGVVLRARDHILFGSAEATLGAEGQPVLDAVAELMQSFPGQLAVEGHSDDRPIESAVFPSNWELSGARAAAVLRNLLRAGVERRRLHVAGYADTSPIASNDTEEGRAQNRRVEFVFEHAAPHDLPTSAQRRPDAAAD